MGWLDMQLQSGKVHTGQTGGIATAPFAAGVCLLSAQRITSRCIHNQFLSTQEGTSCTHAL